MILQFLVITIIAQKEVGTQEQLKQFFKTKTYVVTDDNPMSEYNAEIQNCIKKSWNITEYEFIPLTEFEEKRMNPDCSFLTIDKVYFEKDKTKSNYEFLCLSLGGNYKNISDMPQLCAVPLCYFGTEEENYVYKIGSIINFIQNHIKLTSTNAELTRDNIITHYNKNISSIKGKTFYLVEDEMADDANTEEKIKKVYSSPVKFATREEIQEAIEEGNEDVVFLHKVGPEGTNSDARCFKVVMGASDAKLYYFHFHMIDESNPDGFMLKDFKKLANQ